MWCKRREEEFGQKKFVKLIYLISRVFFGKDFFKFSGPLCDYERPPAPKLDESFSHNYFSKKNHFEFISPRFLMIFPSYIFNFHEKNSLVKNYSHKAKML